MRTTFLAVVLLGASFGALAGACSNGTEVPNKTSCDCAPGQQCFTRVLEGEAIYECADVVPLGGSCTIESDCGLGAYCAFDGCKGAGVCKPWKVSCDSTIMPVLACECSGTVTYVCNSDQPWFPLDPTFGCKLPAGVSGYTCGAVLCGPNGQYCQRATGSKDAFGECKSLPSACQDFSKATCDCFPPDLLKNDIGACACTKTADHFEIRCPVQGP